MNDYSLLIEKVKFAGNEIFWQGSVLDSEILKLEGLLQTSLPNSFKLFLKEFGGGGVVGTEISGIEENNASLDFGGTVFGDTVYVRNEYNLPRNMIVILLRDDEICWCIDLRSKGTLEPPIVSYNLFNQKIDCKIAKNFNDFFYNYLTQWGES